MEEAYEAFREGSRLLASGDVHAAAIVLERARDIEPDQGSIREALARAYFRSVRFPDAAREFQEALRIDPVNDYAHFGLGLCGLRTGDLTGALRSLRIAVAMNPRSDDYRSALEDAERRAQVDLGR